jgi:NADP-dependent 3-hydroxy acid dehydrogenase YdfG
MSSPSPVILILGARPNIGQAVARTFPSKGYKITLAARSLKEADSTDNQLNITIDFANPDDVVNAFTKLKKVLGIPSVVVYNGRTRHQKTQAEYMLKVSKPPPSRHLLPMTHLQSRWMLSAET